MIDPKTIHLNELGQFIFNKPLPCTISHETDDGVEYIVAENKELMIVGVGQTENEAINSMKGHLIVFIYGMNYINPELERSEPSKKIYQKLFEYFNPDKCTEEWLMDELDDVD